jgi:uncharacterized membrane protein (UPF0127 family)
MNKKRRHGLYLMSAGVLLFGVVLCSTFLKPISSDEPSIIIGEKTYTLTPLQTKEEREHGLSDTEKLDGDKGMLFIFDTPDKQGFWMKDMQYPISIIWLDADCVIAGVKALATPESFPEAFYPEKLSLYVIEVNPLDVQVVVGQKLVCHF